MLIGMCIATGNAGALSGPAWVSGIFSNALSFNGASAEVDAPISRSLNATNVLTISAWVNATNTTDRAVVSYRAGGSDSGWRLLYQTGKVLFQWATPGGSHSLQSLGSFPTNQWNHIVAVFAPPNAYLYLNSNLIASNPNAGSNIVLSASRGLQIGRSDDGNPCWFPGKIDDVQVYNRALSTNEIAAMYNADTDGDEIPNWWELAQGLNPNDPSDASQISINPWAHGLTNLQVYQNPSILIADNYSTLNDGIPDWWKVKHGFGLTDPSVAGADTDGDGFTNLQEYLAGTDPRDPNSHPTILLIPNAWAVYSDSNTVQITATIISTNASVTVSNAEWFLDSITGVTNGGGFAMSAADSTFDSTNETATATFAPAFPYGERHVLWVHARGSDTQWCPFKKVIINPNVDDLLDKIQANYSQIADIGYTTTRRQYIDDQVVTTEMVLYRQKGPYKMRWDNQTSGVTTIINGSQIGVIDENGQLTPMYVAIGDDATSGNNRSAYFYWGVDRFKSQHDLGVASPAPNRPGSYRFAATPKAGVSVPYQSLGAEVDFRYGTVTTIDYEDEYGSSLEVEQPSPQEIAPGIWFHSQQNSAVPVFEDWSLRRGEDLQTPTIQINSGSVPDSLFDF